MSWDSKAKYRVYRIREEVDDWHKAHQRRQSSLVKRSKRQLRTWVDKGEAWLAGSGGSDKWRSALWLYTLLGRRLLQGKMRLNTAWDIAMHSAAMERWAAAQANLYELQQERRSEQYRAFLRNQAALEAVVSDYVPKRATRTEGTARPVTPGSGDFNADYVKHIQARVAELPAAAQVELARQISALVSSDLYRMLRGSSSPPPGVTDRQWRNWQKAAAGVEAAFDQAKRAPGWARVALAEQARTAAPAEAVDPATELRDAVLWASERPSQATFDRLQRAMVRARNIPELAPELAEGEEILSLVPRRVLAPVVIDPAEIEPWYVRYRYPLAGAAVLTAVGLLTLTVRMRKAETR